MIPSLQARQFLPAALESCSWDSGWRALLLRQYLDRPTQEQFTTAATPDHLFVLVTAGSCEIETSGTVAGRKRPIMLGTSRWFPLGATSTLRWRSHESHRTLQLHLPRDVLNRQCQELWDRDVAAVELPRLLTSQDPLIQSAMTALCEGMAAGLPDLYAETMAEMLSAHLLLRHCALGSSISGPERDDQRLRRVDDYLRANLHEPVRWKISRPM